MPIHVHSHDTAGTGVATQLACAEAQTDVINCRCLHSLCPCRKQFPDMPVHVYTLDTAGTGIATQLELNTMSNRNSLDTKPLSMQETVP